MDLGLKRKKVVVTGSTSGIGKAIAVCMLEEGADVVINGRDGGKLDEAKEELEYCFPKSFIKGFVGDVTDKRDVDRFYDLINKKWGNIDILIPSVGRGKAFSEDQMSDENWDNLMEINLGSLVYIIKRFEPILNNDGSIVALSSIAAKEVIGAPVAYAAAKQSLNVVVKYLSKTLAERNIRINSVMPGNVCFKGGRWEEILNGDYRGTMEYIESVVPLKRFATPEEVARAVVFLASPASSFTTGAVLTVDGGQTNSIG
jgi:NAD(P)-dependent dehydrogenase (short-subunit alcohol dehydrogenase family)